MLLEAIIFIGLDEISNNALENLREASEILLKEYGVKLIIVPVNTWLDPLNSSIKSLPTIVINGFKAFSGCAPTVDDIKEFVLKTIKLKNRRKDLQLPAGILKEDILTASAIAQ
jgi:hypothetical protein